MADFGISEAMMLAGGLSSGGGTILGALGKDQAGQMQSASYKFKAQQEQQAAGQARAAAQREAFDTQRKGLLAQSTLQARAAADGGTATDPTVLALSQGIAGQSAYNQEGDIFRGEDKARGLENQAAADYYSAKAARQGGSMGAIGTLLSGGGSLLSKFG